jgi:sugar lactone lactonase YvrE
MASRAIRLLAILVLGGIALAPGAPDGRAQARSAAGHRAATVPFTVVARGLDHPKGLAFSASGDLYVAESGHSNSTCPSAQKPAEMTSAGSSGAVAKIAPDGTVTRILTRLRSVCDGSDFIGPSGLAFVGRDLYVTQGQSLCDIGQPPSSCLFSAPLLRVRSDGTVTQVALFVSHGNTPNFPNAHENPFGMARGPDGNLYVSDGGDNSIWKVRPGGDALRLVDRPSAHFPHDPTLTGLAFGKDGSLYVAVFSALPFARRTGWVARVTADGRIQKAVTGLTVPIGVAFSSAGTMYVLQYAGGFTLQPFPQFVPESGAVWRRTGSSLEQVVGGLNFPTAMAFGPDGKLYITNNGTGTKPEAEGEVVTADVGS